MTSPRSSSAKVKPRSYSCSSADAFYSAGTCPSTVHFQIYGLLQLQLYDYSLSPTKPPNIIKAWIEKLPSLKPDFYISRRLFFGFLTWLDGSTNRTFEKPTKWVLIVLSKHRWSTVWVVMLKICAIIMSCHAKLWSTLCIICCATNSRATKITPIFFMVHFST